MAHVVLTYPLTDGTAAKGSEVRANDDAIVGQVNGNLDDSNIKTGAAIDGNKLSNLAGFRVPEDRIADDAITASKLRDDNDAGDANRAVTSDHIRNLAVITSKLAASAVTAPKLAALAVLSGHVKTGTIDYAPGGNLAAGASGYAAALLPANGIPLYVEVRYGGAPPAAIIPIASLFYNTAGNQWYIIVTNPSAGLLSLVGYTFRMVYIAVS